MTRPAGEPLGTRTTGPHNPDGWDSGRGQNMRLDDWAGELHRRITVALAELDQAESYGFQLTHDQHCWKYHARCLAARIRATLLGDDRGADINKEIS